MKTNQAISSFIHYLQYIDPKSESTIQAYSNDLKSYESFLDENNVFEVNNIDFNLINAYIIKINETLAFSSVQRRIVSIRQFHQYCIKLNISSYDPTQFLAIKNKGSRLIKSASNDTLIKLLSHDNSDKEYFHYLIFLMLYQCGLRVSECSNLSLNQVYIKEKWLRISGKGNKERMVPMSDALVEALEYYLNNIRPKWLNKNTDRVFINAKGNLIQRQSIHNMIKSKCKKEGIQQSISAHSLRHSFASSILEEGLDLRTIQELLGHSDISTTQIYTHIQDETLKREYDQFLSGGFTNQGGKSDEEI